MKALAAFLRNERASTAAEFALILPAALLVLLGIIDTGRYAWNMNRLEKAVQMGARYAVATDVIAPGLNTANYVGFACPGGALTAGDTICQGALGTVTCSKPASSVSCTCAASSIGSASCPTLGTPNATAWTNIATRIRRFAPQAADARITVSYAGSGIGFAGDPATATTGGGALGDVSPIVTVTIADVPMRALTLMGWGMKLPRASYSLTLEDGDGAVAY